MKPKENKPWTSDELEVMDMAFKSIKSMYE